MNKFVQNVHTISLVELLTLDVVVTVLIGLYLAQYLGYTGLKLLAVLVIVLLLNSLTHSYLGIATNMNYYFGIGNCPKSLFTC